ncbi:hypothetical protein [Bradyrhizobium sp. DASA03007]|uniref:hypothetical protein n=1 Tax=unclassified Bradyrhizobium TaxID=2631580 RepID=UPI003F710949
MPHVFDHTPTAQEIFDQACVYFATTDGPSTRMRSYGDACLYRNNETGRECIAGHFIPDDKYSPAMDDLTQLGSTYKGGGSGIENLLVYFAGLPSWFAEHLPLLKSLQKVHDEHHNWTEDRSWNYAGLAISLNSVSAVHKLNPKAIEQVKARRVPAGWQSVEA